MRDDLALGRCDRPGQGTSLILFDVSRLLAQARRPTASGINRVELAYAKHLLVSARHRLVLTAAAYWGEVAALPFEPVAHLIAALDSLWRGDAEPSRVQKALSATARQARFYLHVHGARALRQVIGPRRNDIVYLLVSHHHLDRAQAIARLKSDTGARFVCFVHDTIPADYPALSKRSQAKRHRRRLETVADLADLAIVNSAATRDALEANFPDRRLCPIAVAPLGVEDHLRRNTNAVPGTRPYFVCVSTIEPKKNQMLLLDAWKGLRQELGDHAPRLILIGRRKPMDHGALDRAVAASPELRGFVSHFDFLPDRAMAHLIAGARAALLPSLAEGYGLAAAEALTLGVPVLCSDLAALREVGGAVSDYLDPRDVGAWHEAIREYAAPDSARRRSQLARLEAWRAPRWADHFALVRPLLDGDLRDVSAVHREQSSVPSPTLHEYV